MFYIYIFTLHYIVEAIIFTKELENLNLKQENIKAVFECEISKSGLRVNWFKGDKQLRRDEKYDIEVDGKFHRLIIDKVKVEDVGDYSATYEKLTTSAKLNLAGNFISYLNISS
jgi:obscurin-RhoGEF protein